MKDCRQTFGGLESQNFFIIDTFIKNIPILNLNTMYYLSKWLK